MIFTESDIAKLTKEYGERLRQASVKITTPNPKLSELQDWMEKECVESPEVLKLAIEKVGKGEKVEKKMSQVRRKNKESGDKN